jgi:hypothetical protein
MKSDKPYISSKQLESNVNEICEHEHILLREFPCQLVVFIRFLEVRMLVCWNMYIKSGGLYCIKSQIKMK